MQASWSPYGWLGAAESFKQIVAIMANFEEKNISIGTNFAEGGQQIVSILTNIPIMGRSIMTNCKNLWTGGSLKGY